MRAAPAARSPRDTAITPVVNARRAGVEPRPYGGLRNVVGPAVAAGKGRRGRRPLRRVGNGPRAAGFTARLSHARAGAGGTR